MRKNCSCTENQLRNIYLEKEAKTFTQLLVACSFVFCCYTACKSPSVPSSLCSMRRVNGGLASTAIVRDSEKLGSGT